jgi:Uma2 family endonuclease
MTATVHEPVRTFADVWERLGGVPLKRILSEPAPGTAVEADVLRLHDHENRLFELVDGVLVEKPMGFLESRLALKIAQILENFVEQHDLGIAVGADGMMRLARGLVRIPDVAVILWSKLPDRQIPTEPIPNLSPDLAVEVVSKSNTTAEMKRKIGEYFAAGTQVVWIVDPLNRSVTVHSALDARRTVTNAETVSAGAVLPGFQISVDELFSRAGIS